EIDNNEDDDSVDFDDDSVGFDDEDGSFSKEIQFLFVYN
ncbi:unnamed protein product, partial [Rotaria sordida]